MSENPKLMLPRIEILALARALGDVTGHMKDVMSKWTATSIKTSMRAFSDTYTEMKTALDEKNPKAFHEERAALCKELGSRDETGTLIVKDGNYAFTPENKVKLDSAVQKLRDVTHKDSCDAYEAAGKDLDTFLKGKENLFEATSIKPTARIKLSGIQDTVPGNVLEALSPLIHDDISEPAVPAAK